MSELFRVRWKHEEFLLDLGQIAASSSSRLFHPAKGWEKLLSHYTWTRESDGSFSLPDGSKALFLGGKIFLHSRGRTFQFHLSGKESGEGESHQNEIKSPMPGKLIKLEIHPGALVKKGDVLAVVEAMKMEHALKAVSDAKVEEVFVKAGDLVSQDQVLIVLSLS
ncbi:acetyl-CoA carboxylase biotin carboxyl carrier protein subunit [Leptospira perolatii]|uniref:Acetyl-CoA carboxylase biotin carboxyl carrier protein subunit n=1 Tax=Leptospira perolatii TaxID=2023191 RepID=A0A2M9ZQE2_9LEPT|nr:acetyl-CoA carboxylase biotin carboxyl carrier protein subunit [Leptospira perolatii]PJZ68075.1 acetyl-CoA carboxylase biotin carboxyl carrier protein subunit [Leptospira perolatii]PJZ74191.1 acetyl-CoA carboxylase biotin carboxyl carrier protein subunit [Leptospira perolatii]